MGIYRAGQVNVMGLTNPGVTIIEQLPTSQITGVPTNLQGKVGVASWGPVNTVVTFGSMASGIFKLGAPQVRFADLMTHAMVGWQEGAAAWFAAVRVTDGTDVAASYSLSNAGTFTAKYSGTVGNGIQVTFQNSVLAGAYAAVVSVPGQVPERFDNINQAIANFTVTPGTGYTSPPALNIAAPSAVGGVQAVAQATLKVVSATIGAGGSGYVTGDKVYLSNGVVLSVTATAGAITAATVFSAGTLTGGSIPTNPVTPASTSGSGTGATFTLVWGLGTPILTNAGSGYTTTNPTVTVTGGGGTGGTMTANASFWGGLAAAVNNGNTQRGPSNFVLFTPAATPSASVTVGTSYSLTGGTDGANGVTSAVLVGTDGSNKNRTGMYALRGSGCDAFALCDCTDSSTWSTQIAFAISEGMLAVATTPSGDTIANAVATRTSQGIDDPSIWIIEGDYPTIYDSYNGMKRLVSPQCQGNGLLGNLSPEQSPINKRLNSVIATQTSMTGLLTDDADESTAQTGGIDFIGRSAALGVDYFSFMTGRNASSNTQARGIEWTRMENFIARSLNGVATKQIIGLLQSASRPDDPTRQKASAILNSYLQTLVDPTSGSNGYGMIDAFAVQCDTSNNSPATVAQGFLFAYCAVRFLSVVRYFVITLAGGNNVSVALSTTPPANSNAALLALAA